MKKLTICFACLIASYCGNTQARVGIQGGYHASTANTDFYTTDNVLTTTRSALKGGHFGITADIPIYKKLVALQTGLAYYKRGQKQVLILDTSSLRNHSITVKQEQNYLDFPLNIAFKPAISKKLRFVIGSGIQLSLFTSGREMISDFKKITEKKFNGEDTTYVVIKENKQDNVPVGKDVNKYKLSFFSLNSFAGFELKNVYLTANYSKGLTDYFDRPGEHFKYGTWSATLGIYLYRAKPEPEVTKKKDADNDGIPDFEDECPSVVGSSLTNGCPDRDSDGIQDSKDQCPDSSGILKYNGCPIPDTDGDGINDEEDQCPQQAGQKDNSGCPVLKAPEVKLPEVKEEVIEEKVIQQINMSAKQIAFKSGKAELTNESYQVLDEIVALLKDTDAKIKVEGHSSLDGNAAVNLKLSQERAESVKRYLVSKGLLAERITAIGYGTTRPLVKEISAKANAQNRRVEISLDK